MEVHWKKSLFSGAKFSSSIKHLQTLSGLNESFITSVHLETSRLMETQLLPINMTAQIWRPRNPAMICCIYTEEPNINRADELKLQPNLSNLRSASHFSCDVIPKVLKGDIKDKALQLRLVSLEFQRMRMTNLWAKPRCFTVSTISDCIPAKFGPWWC